MNSIGCKIGLMKRTIAALAIMMAPICAHAQKNNVFADIGIHGDFTPGASVTYNHKLTNHFGVGGGTQMYMERVSITSKSTTIYKPAIYGDLRGYFPIGKSILFLLGDLGLHIYHGASALNAGETRNNGLYVGMGVGYGHSIGKKHLMDGYVTLKAVTDNYFTHQSSTSGTFSEYNMEGSMVLSVGVRF